MRYDRIIMLDPARYIIGRFASRGQVAQIAGVHRTRVSNWMRPKAKGGTGGVIPQGHHRALLDFARENGIPLEAEDFIPASPTSSEPEARQ